MKRIITFILAAITGASILFAQKDQEWSQARREIHENILMTGSNFKSYMEPTEKPTRSPKGYEPFYISTYARHGSRWLCSDSEYTDAMGILERAHEKNNLTERGELLREQLNQIHETAINRIGDLTPLGEKQHHGRPEVEEIGQHVIDRRHRTAPCHVHVAGDERGYPQGDNQQCDDHILN